MIHGLEWDCGQRLMAAFDGTEPTAEVLADVEAGRLAGLTLFRARNVSSPEQVRQLAASLQAATARAGHPRLLIAADQEGGQLAAIGGTTPFPGNMALGAAGSAELARQAGLALGHELAAVGVNVDYAPVCDVNSNARNPVVGLRSFGEAPAAVARLAAAMVDGLQAAGVAATAKHFPGHGDTSGDSHYALPLLAHDRDRLRRVDLPPFAAAIGAGVRLVMAGHLALPLLEGGSDLPASRSPFILQGLLRDELGFQGVAISDAMDMGAALQGGQEVSLELVSVAAVRAGIDLLLLTASARRVHQALVQAVARGLLPRGQLAAGARRVLDLKEWLPGRPQPGLEVVGCAAHRALAAEIAARAVTLLGDGQEGHARLLPLRLAAHARILAVVPWPVDLTPADTSSYAACTLAAALRRLHPAVDEIVMPHAPAPGDVAAIRQRAEECDLVVVGTSDARGQPGQAAVVRALAESGVPLVAIALRLPYDLAAYPQVLTTLCTYGLAEPSMDALAQGLWGLIPFRGRLPVSIPGLYPLGHAEA